MVYLQAAVYLLTLLCLWQAWKYRERAKRDRYEAATKLVAASQTLDEVEEFRDRVSDPDRPEDTVH